MKKLKILLLLLLLLPDKGRSEEDLILEKDFQSKDNLHLDEYDDEYDLHYNHLVSQLGEDADYLLSRLDRSITEVVCNETGPHLLLISLYIITSFQMLIFLKLKDLKWLKSFRLLYESNGRFQVIQMGRSQKFLEARIFFTPNSFQLALSTSGDTRCARATSDGVVVDSVDDEEASKLWLLPNIPVIGIDSAQLTIRDLNPNMEFVFRAMIRNGSRCGPEADLRFKTGLKRFL